MAARHRQMFRVLSGSRPSSDPTACAYVAAWTSGGSMPARKRSVSASSSGCFKSTAPANNARPEASLPRSSSTAITSSILVSLELGLRYRIQHDRLHRAAALLRRTAPRVIHQDAAHALACHRQEVILVGPVRALLL